MRLHFLRQLLHEMDPVQEVAGGEAEKPGAGERACGVKDVTQKVLDQISGEMRGWLLGRCGDNAQVAVAIAFGTAVQISTDHDQVEWFMRLVDKAIAARAASAAAASEKN